MPSFRSLCSTTDGVSALFSLSLSAQNMRKDADQLLEGPYESSGKTERHGGRKKTRQRQKHEEDGTETEKRRKETEKRRKDKGRQTENHLPFSRMQVDDLLDISALETYIAKSAVVLIFLSKGYFVSRNCLREVRSSVKAEKPLVLVHEADVRFALALFSSVLKYLPGTSCVLYLLGTLALRRSKPLLVPVAADPCTNCGEKTLPNVRDCLREERSCFAQCVCNGHADGAMLSVGGSGDADGNIVR
eukprot:6198559-Pleurochrysis_carterae.AAC.3